MPVMLFWDEDASRYVRTRSQRYPGAVDIEPEWRQEVVNDVDLVAFEPDPKSRMGACRFIGQSSSAGRLLTVIAYRDLDGDLHLINAWPATGADRAFYIRDGEQPEEIRNGEDD